MVTRSWFTLQRFPGVRDTLPASIREIMQNGLLDATFQDALLPEFLFPRLATPRPWRANMGDTVTFTRTGLLAPVTAPITGSDPTPSSYSIEQYSMTMEQYGNAIDTNLLQSSMTLASKFLEDQQKLAINAGQSLNRIARDKLYRAYAGGRTWCTEAGTSDTTIKVQSVDGFTHVLVNGKPTPVSPSNPLSVTIEGVANTVVGVDAQSSTLTLGTARADAVGDSVVAGNAPVSYRPGGKDTAYDLVSTDVVTFSLFMDAVARLRAQNVPTIGGAYVAHIDPVTERQLFDDNEFKQAYQGRGDSPVFQNMSLGRFAGIDWVRNNEVPTVQGNGITVHRPIVVGGDALIAGPYEDMGSLVAELPSNAIAHDFQMIGPADGVQVVRIIRAPQDRLGQVVSAAWSWIGDFAVPTDSVTGDAALYKRAVVIEHA